MAIREEREREESKEREKALEKGEVLLIKMSRFVFIATAIINPLQVNIHSNNNNKNNESRTEQEKKEREEKEPYLDMRREEPLLRFPGFNALFYTTCLGGHQRSPTSPVRSIME